MCCKGKQGTQLSVTNRAMQSLCVQCDLKIGAGSLNGLLVHGQLTIIFVVSVGLSVCLCNGTFIYSNDIFLENREVLLLNPYLAPALRVTSS